MMKIITQTIELPKPHTAQVRVLKSTARFVVVACGRRFGKTTLGQRAIIREALVNHKACWWLAPTYGMASQVWRDLKFACAHVEGIRISETDRRIDFPTGGWLAIRSTHTPDNLRGAGLDFAVLDEAAYMDSTVWPEVVRPMLLERRGRALFLSSPNGLNWFWEIYQLGLHPSSSSKSASDEPHRLGTTLAPSDPASSPPLHPMERGEPKWDECPLSANGGEVATNPLSANAGEVAINPLSANGSEVLPPLIPHPSSLSTSPLAPSTSHLALPYKEDRRTWRSFTFPSSANPIITPDELETIRAQTTEHVWRQEYLAEFTADLGQVFRGIRDAATAPLHAVPVPGVRYVCGLDWGRDHDATVIVILRADTRHMVAIDRFNQVSWTLQRGRLKYLYDRWQPVAIWAESNSIGSPNIEALQAEGLPVRPFNTTAKSKPPLIEDLALAIERRELALLPDETLLAEFATYTMRRTDSGAYTYSAPSGLHDDCVIATALAWYGLRHSSLSIDFA